MPPSHKYTSNHLDPDVEAFRKPSGSLKAKQHSFMYHNIYDILEKRLLIVQQKKRSLRKIDIINKNYEYSIYEMIAFILMQNIFKQQY